MNFVLKKTNDLSDNEIMQLCDLFRDVFGVPKGVEDFENKFKKTFTGYSYHALMLDNEKIVGSYSAIPVEYNYFGKKFIFAQSVDTMINEEYRGNAFNLKKIANLVYKELIKDSVSFVFGFPNENIYIIRKKLLKWKDIGGLDFYILPINIGSIRAGLKTFNLLSRCFSTCINIFPDPVSKLSKFDDDSFYIKKVNNICFGKNRYDKSFDLITINDNSYLVYKIKKYVNKNSAHLIDVFPFTKAVFQSAVKFILEKEKDNIDEIVFQGKLPFMPINMIKVTGKLKPSEIKASGRILIPENIDENIFNLDNWNLNLSDSDWA